MNLHDCETLIGKALHPQADANTLQQAGRLLAPHQHMSPDTQLLVYRHNISGSYINAMTTTFNTCQTIIGEACFGTLVRDYAWNQPAQHADLNRLGEGFPGFLEHVLAEHAEFADYGYLADLARLEWFIEKAYQAEDDVSGELLDEKALDALPPKDIYPVLSRSVHLLSTDYPVYDIWCAHRRENALTAIHGLEARDYLCLCRDKNDDVIISHISKDLFQILLAGHIGQSLLLMTNTAPVRALEQLVQAMQQGLIIGFRNSDMNTDE